MTDYAEVAVWWDSVRKVLCKVLKKTPVSE